jgi:putative PIN family toxin of toxin-antitoxin system
MRAVIDTNVLVSAVILPKSHVGQIVPRLQEAAFVPLYHAQLLAELIHVLGRRRIQQRFHITIEDIQAITDLIVLRGQCVEPVRHFEVCRDPKDNFLLDIAFAAQADVIVSGDEDLLVLHPFGNVRIVTPREFLLHIAQS